MYWLDFDSYGPVENDAERKVDSRVLVCVTLSNRHGDNTGQEQSKEHLSTLGVIHFASLERSMSPIEKCFNTRCFFQDVKKLTLPDSSS